MVIHHTFFSIRLKVFKDVNLAKMRNPSLLLSPLLSLNFLISLSFCAFSYSSLSRFISFLCVLHTLKPLLSFSLYCICNLSFLLYPYSFPLFRTPSSHLLPLLYLFFYHLSISLSFSSFHTRGFYLTLLVLFVSFSVSLSFLCIRCFGSKTND